MAPHVPAVTLQDGPAGPVACISRTGMKVWQVIQLYREAGEDWAPVRAAFPHLQQSQLDAALAYSRAFGPEIDAQIAANEAFDIESYWRRHPFTRPPWRAAPTADEGEHPSRPGRAKVQGRRTETRDREHLSRAAADNRVFVTRDYETAAAMTVEFYARGLPHAGVLCLSPALSRQSPDAQAEVIARYAEAHSEGLPPYTLDWLLPVDERHTPTGEGDQ